VCYGMDTVVDGFVAAIVSPVVSPCFGQVLV